MRSYLRGLCERFIKPVKLLCLLLIPTVELLELAPSDVDAVFFHLEVKNDPQYVQFIIILNSVRLVFFQFMKDAH